VGARGVMRQNWGNSKATIGSPNFRRITMNNSLDDPIMHTFGGQVSAFIGLFLVALAFAAVPLIIFKLIPPMRRRPGLSNGIAGALGVLATFLPANTPLTQRIVVALLLAALFFWQYGRDVRALANAPSAKETTPQP
jgi:hypothetical protein